MKIRHISQGLPSPRKVLLIFTVAFIALAGCTAGEDGESTAESLPVVDLDLDEDVPADLVGIAKESDFVILASIEEVKPGARFYGGTDEDPDSSWTEDVSIDLSVEEVFKGQPGEVISIAWPGFENSAADSKSRSQVLRVEGVTLNGANSKQRYLFFLKDHGEPWGLTATFLSAGVVQVDPANRITGQVSTVFNEFKGTDLDEVLQRAGLS